jgi:hypothetical protein
MIFLSFAHSALFTVLSSTVAMVVFALGETILSPLGTEIDNDIAPEHRRARYNGAGTHVGHLGNDCSGHRGALPWQWMRRPMAALDRSRVTGRRRSGAQPATPPQCRSRRANRVTEMILRKSIDRVDD